MPTANESQLTFGDALAAHDRALQFGGARGIVNCRSIRAAIARPYAGYYCSIASKAAALTESLVANHGFVDGNKRTAVILVNLLVERSGYRLRAEDTTPIQQEVEDLVLAVARNQLSFEELVDWLERRLGPA